MYCDIPGLNRDDAMDRSRWRRQIGIFDDHDGCEWVNVSSGTGSPGLSQTKSTEPQNGCVVCMCDYDIPDHNLMLFLIILFC